MAIKWWGYRLPCAFKGTEKAVFLSTYLITYLELRVTGKCSNTAIRIRAAPRMGIVPVQIRFFLARLEIW